MKDPSYFLFSPLSLHQDGWFYPISLHSHWIAPALVPTSNDVGTHMTSKNLKRRWPQTWVIPLRGKPFQKPHQADFPQWPEWDPRSIPKSITVQGTRTTTGRTIGTHRWARRESPDAQTNHVPCFWFLNRATVLFARTKDGAVGGGEKAGSGASLGDTPTISIIAHSLPGVLRI